LPESFSRYALSSAESTKGYGLSRGIFPSQKKMLRPYSTASKNRRTSFSYVTVFAKRTAREAGARKRRYRGPYRFHEGKPRKGRQRPPVYATLITIYVTLTSPKKLKESISPNYYLTGP
jgi:hypothetical protein